MSMQTTRHRPRWMLALLIALGFAVAALPAGAEELTQEQVLERALAKARAVERDLVGVLDTVTNASVTVIHHARLPAALGGGPDGPLFVNGAGSGVLVSYRGTYVITNAHVVAGAANVEIVTRDGREIPVTVKARDKARDLAVLELPKKTTGLKPVALESRASTQLREGAWVVATGNPFMLAHDGHGAATLGVFSGAREAPRRGMGSGSEYLLQHDAEINPGNSGGPLWSRRGDLLGINGAIVTRSMRMGGGPSYTGTSISVPVAQVQSFLDRVLTPPKPSRIAKADEKPAAKPRVQRRSRAGFLGLRLRTSVDARNQPDGALVVGVDRRSALRGRAGLRSGDRITHLSVAGKRYRVRSRAEFETVLTGSAKAKRISIHYVRGRRSLTWSGAVSSLGGQ